MCKIRLKADPFGDLPEKWVLCRVRLRSAGNGVRNGLESHPNRSDDGFRAWWATIPLGVAPGSEYEKGIRWMPWHQEAMKDVARCEKPWGAASRL